MEDQHWLSSLGVIAHWTIVLLLGLRVINKRQSPEFSLAWIAVVAAFPYVGAVAYLVVAEPWLSERRTRRIASLTDSAREKLRERLQTSPRNPEQTYHEAVMGLRRLAASTNAMPLVFNNHVELLDDFDAIFPRLMEDVRSARRSIDLLFFIFQPKGRVLEFVDELIAAAGRGVRVRVVVDGVGGRQLLKSPHAARLRDAGVDLRASLPVRFLRIYAARVDIRNHRKLVVIDEAVAYTGSFNIIDPAQFKRGEGVGRWVDIMARITGPSIPAFKAAFEIDRALETNEDPFAAVERDIEEAAAAQRAELEEASVADGTTSQPLASGQRRLFPTIDTGDAPIQIVPSGPGQNPGTLHKLLLHAVHGAEEELVISSPYFMPDPAMMLALEAARERGVRLVVVSPRRIDGPLVALATRGFLRDLHEQGVEVLLYTGGLLHAKTVVVDRSFCMLGTANFDRRSFWINFELNIFAYDAATSRRLRDIQQRYMDGSIPFDECSIANRGKAFVTLENAAQLASPLL